MILHTFLVRTIATDNNCYRDKDLFGGIRPIKICRSTYYIIRQHVIRRNLLRLYVIQDVLFVARVNFNSYNKKT